MSFFLPRPRLLFIATSFLTMLSGSPGLAADPQARVVEIENDVQTAKGNAGAWSAAKPGQSLAVRDRIMTGEYSRATLQVTEQYSIRLEELTSLQLVREAFADGKPKLELPKGAYFLFSREKAGTIDIDTPSVHGGSIGTQLFVRVEGDGTTRLQVFEGRIDLSNPAGSWTLVAGEAGEVAPGQPLRRTPSLEPSSILQWALYYPAVLDPADLALGPAEEHAVAASLAAYRAGDLLGALTHYPDRQPSNQGGHLYHAGVLLAVGRVDDASRSLQRVPAGHPGRLALERMIATVHGKQLEPRPIPSLGTVAEAIAESYYRQSQAEIEEARAAALRATELAPRNGYAWTRLAEIEFSRGDTRRMGEALDRAKELTPRNAQTLALQGFVYSAENRLDHARQSFQDAIDLDGALGNGWLGRGLVRIKSGDLAGGRADLQIAATVEPTTSLFHSYLSKAFSMENKPVEARKDLDLARTLDPRDPTPWLYSALEHQRNYRPHAAIEDLQESILRNENRRIYRSRFLLDQDLAVRSANLASIYQNAGMREVAVREATRAVESDYTNPSAHLFLANSFHALRDPDRVQLRYETPWSNELLLANLLSPVGGGPLSQFISQQEYSKLLEADGLGGSLLSELRSDGESRTAASLFGNHGNISFGIDAYYRNDNGDRFNNDFELAELYGQFKWQVTPDDIFYVLGKWQDKHAGDNFQTYDNQPLEPFADFEENQEPGLLLAGWNHRWAPGSNTLFLAGHLAAEQILRNPQSQQLLVERDADGLRPGFIQQDEFGEDVFTDPSLNGSVTVGPDGESLVYSKDLMRAIQPYLGRGEVLGVSGAPFSFETRRNFEIETAELQHIFQTDRNLLIAGGRWQTGEFETDTRLLADRPNFDGGFETPAANQHSKVDFERLSLYAYDYWNITPCLTLIGGVAWDHIEHPDNFRNPPVNDLQREDEEFSGKAGFTYVPNRWVTLRGVYTEGLGGVTFDESVRLEPVQIAGFNQAYRTVISESIAGSVETPRFEIWGLSAEGRLPTHTWWGASLNVIEEEVDRTRGIFTGYRAGVFPVRPAYFADSMAERLDYREESATLTVNQWLGDQFSVGAGLRVTRSELLTTLPELPVSIAPFAHLDDEATLTEVMLSANWNSPTGWFARAEANHFSQDLEDDPARGQPRSGDSFWHFNVLAGYRFNQNMCEIAAGVLNIGDNDYHLSPLNPRDELVHGRTAVLRCRLNF